MSRDEHGGRVYDKGHICYFCNKRCLKIARHLLSVHKSEAEVMQIISIDSKSKEGCNKRANALDILRYRGDFYHNLKVLKTGGELIVYRRPGNGEECHASDFTPCMHCLAFIRKHDLWRHVRQCPFNKRKERFEPENVAHQKLQYESELLLYSSQVPNGCSEALASVLPSIRPGEVKLTLKADKLILLVGSSLLERGGSSKMQPIINTMRTLSRLLLKVQELQGNSSVECLSDCIDPRMFDIIIRATKTLAGYDPGTKDKSPSYSKPGLALSIGYDLKKAAMLLRGQGIRQNNKDLIERANRFIELYELEWKTYVSTAAGRALDQNKFNAPSCLPATADLVKLRQYAGKEIKDCILRMDANPTLQDWRFLAELAAARIIVFNKRRGNEGTKLTIEQFQSRPDWKEIQLEDVKKSLQPLEKELCKRYACYTYLYFFFNNPCHYLKLPH